MKKKIFITGGSSFIGRNLKEQLREGYNIIAPSHKELDLLDTKTVNEYFKRNKIDTIVHAALYIGPKKKEFAPDILRKNLIIFFNLIANRKRYKKLIVLGSGAEYNKARPIINVTEEDFGQSIPEDDYGFLKYCISKYVEQIRNVYALRLFAVYGKYEDYTRRFISQAICRTLFNLPIVIKQNVYFDYLFIDDLVKIIEFFIDRKPKYKWYNVGRGEKIDLLTIAKMIKKNMHSQHKIRILHPGWNNEYTCNNARLLSEIKGFQFTDFDQSLKILQDWYTMRKSHIGKEDLVIKE